MVKTSGDYSVITGADLTQESVSTAVMDSDNLVLGAENPDHITGQYNISIAGNKMTSNLTSGDENIVICADIRQNKNMTGSRNIFITDDTLKSATTDLTGSDNIMIGAPNQAWSLRGTSYGNIGIGTTTANNWQTVDKCISMPYSCGVNFINGVGCNFIGWSSGNKTTSGTNYTTGNNNTGLGYDARINNSVNNQMAVGGVSSTVYYYSKVARSDKYDKYDILPIELSIDEIDKIRPVEYRWNYREFYQSNQLDDGTVPFDTEGHKNGTKKRIRLHTGFIAEELNEIIDIDKFGMIKNRTYGTDEEDNFNLDYNELTPLLWKKVQSLKLIIEDNKKRIDALKKKNK